MGALVGRFSDVAKVAGPVVGRSRGSCVGIVGFIALGCERCWPLNAGEVDFIKSFHISLKVEKEDASI